METTTPLNQITPNAKPGSQEATTQVAGVANENAVLSTNKPPIIHHTKNLYPVVRHILLVVFVLFSIALIVLLMHQNGKSIYDNGI